MGQTAGFDALQAPRRTSPDRSAERYLAFAFAAADLLLEADQDGVIGFAAGAFQIRFGADAQQFIGRRITTLFHPASHDALEVAMVVAEQSGRILPLSLRLSDPAGTLVSVGALQMRLPGRRASFSFAIGPMPLAPPGGEAEAGGMADQTDFARMAEAALRQGSGNGVSLVEVKGWARLREALSVPDRRALEEALETALGAASLPAALLAEGRYGVLTPDGGGSPAELAALLSRFEAALRSTPTTCNTIVEGASLKLDTAGLPAAQTVRALRYVLDRFVAGGHEAAGVAGLQGGLAGILQTAEQHTAAMRAALRERRFRLAYQPVVRLSDRSVHHYEALLRPVPTPNVPMTNTQEFVTFAEAVGLSEELDWAVLETAIVALQANPRVYIAVNMSGLSMQNPDYRRCLLDRLAELRLADTNHAAARLLIELTETAEIADLHAAASSMEQLRSVGVPVCLDDFGAGAAVFRYLRAFGVDFVKLDGDYVRSACRTRRDRQLVASMIEIATSSGAAVVAEMIETEAECAVMTELGVTYGQGWLFGRPGNLPG